LVRGFIDMSRLVSLLTCSTLTGQDVRSLSKASFLVVFGSNEELTAKIREDLAEQGCELL
jgi:hypothetical protein